MKHKAWKSISCLFTCYHCVTIFIVKLTWTFMYSYILNNTGEADKYRLAVSCWYLKTKVGHTKTKIGLKHVYIFIVFLWTYLWLEIHPKFGFILIFRSKSYLRQKLVFGENAIESSAGSKFDRNYIYSKNLSEIRNMTHWYALYRSK